MNQEATRDLQTAPSQVGPPPVPLHRYLAADSVVHACAPPIVERRKAVVQTSETTFPELEHDPFHIDVRSDDSSGKRESAGWLSSFALHAVLIVLFTLLLAPADFGETATRYLYVTLTQEAEEEIQMEVATFVDEVVPDEAPPQFNPPPAAVPAAEAVPVDAPLLVADSSGASGESIEPSRSNATNGNAAPRGSFFGIETVGHEFVYVLDMSGSMRGRRYHRATAELIRSVSELRETQKFYVLLFDDSAVRMFNDRSASPTSIPATPANKEKLSEWLTKAYGGGGTDPRHALYIALRMNPSAVFMLSDGEFNGKKKQRRTNLLGANSDTFSIVAAAATDAPIHAIAFEDPSSCVNMKRLAEMTSGEYRFAEAQGATLANESLGYAMDALGRGDRAAAEFLFREVVTSFGPTEAGWKAREELAAMLFESAMLALEEDKLDVATESLLSIIQSDPQAVVTEEIQQSLITEIVRRSGPAAPDGPASAAEVQKTAISTLSKVVNAFPEAKTLQQFVGLAADELLAESRSLRANDQSLAAIKRLDELLRRYPHTSAAKVCRPELLGTMDDLMTHAEALRKTADDVAAVASLRALEGSLQSTEAKDMIRRKLAQLAKEMLTKVRDAGLRRDPVAQREASRQLTEGFAGDEILRQIDAELTSKELKGRNMLRRANRLERAGNFDQAVEQYNVILDLCGGTLSAGKALDRLRDLRRDDTPTEEPNELLELIRNEVASGR